MVLALILGIVLALLAFLLFRWFANADPAALLRSLRNVGLVFLLGVMAALVFSGRGAVAFGLIMLALPFVPGILRKIRQRQAFARMGTAGGGGNASTAETRFLAMSLDHGTGTIDGVILDGPRVGSRLGALSMEELTELWQHYTVEDPPSAEMLEAYLERVHPHWRDGMAAGKAPPDTASMTRRDALKLLGLDDTAGEAEIRGAHRRLIARVHPDHGGSAYLAAEINRARDVLLGKGQ